MTYMKNNRQIEAVCINNDEVYNVVTAFYQRTKQLKFYLKITYSESAIRLNICDMYSVFKDCDRSQRVRLSDIKNQINKQDIVMANYNVFHKNE